MSNRIFSQLAGRVDVELHSRELVDLRGQPLELAFELDRHLLELAAVDGDPRELHRRQHFDERQLELAIDPFELVFHEPALHALRKPQHPLGALGGEPSLSGLGGGGLRRRSHSRKDSLGLGRLALGGERFLQELEDEIGELLRAARGVQNVGGDLGVEPDAGNRHPPGAEESERPFERVADLRNGRFGEQRRETIYQKLLGDPRPRRSIDSLAGFDRQADAEKAAAPGVEETLSLRIAQVEPQRQPLLLPGAGEETIQLRRRLQGEEIRAQVHRFLGRHVVLHDRRELELLEEAPRRLAVGPVIPEFLEPDVEIEVGGDGHELLREPRSLTMLLEGLPLPLVPHLGSVLQERFEAPVLADELRRALLADAGNSGNVVDAVSHQRENVRHLSGRNPELVPDSFGIEPFVLHRVDDRDVVVHELQQVLVRGDDEHEVAFLDRPPREGSDEIVRLDPRSLENREPERCAELSSVRGLLFQAVGSGGPVRLVCRKLLVTEGAPAGVERHRGEIVRLVGQDLAQHVGETEHGVGGEPGAGRERRDGEERPIEEVVAVEQE